MEKIIKNIEHRAVLPLADQVVYQTGQVVSRTLAQNSRHSLTLFAFDEGEEISAHESGGDAMVFALDGVGKITIDAEEYVLRKGEAIVMPARVPHAVYAQERFKMLLMVSFPESKEDPRVKIG
jgi:quercetin dioxygenase-like cupin family protein